MFKIKICGLTNVDDALAAFDAGADGIGLNFYEKSKRYVDVATARKISDELYKAAAGPGRSFVYPIGVFVNHSASEVRRIVQESRLVAAQLHGDEPPEFVAALPRIPTIRARRLDECGVSMLTADLTACLAAVDAMPADERASCDLLLDAAAPGQYGGSGETVDWSMLVDHARWLRCKHLILAGGLTPDNVAEAIRIVRPHAVDVASGVESSPGVKDAAKMCDFVAAAHEAFAAL